MTFAQILADLYRKTNYASAPASEVVTRFKAHVNETVQDLLGVPGMAAWIARQQPPVTFASVANQAVYALPLAVDRVDAIVDRTTDLRLIARSESWWRSAYPDPSADTGTPDSYIPLGFQAVSVQPTAATGLWAVSTAGGDTTQTVYVETVRTGGNPFSGSLSLNGTTRVQLGSATDHEQVTKFYLSAVGVGDIRLYDAAADGNLLATIPIGQTFARYYAFALAPTPASAITYYVDGERPLPDMANDTDQPPIPPRFHRLIVDGALWREWEKKDDSRAASAQRRFAQGVTDLRYFLTCPPDFLPVMGTQVRERSRLGAAYDDGAGIV